MTAIDYTNAAGSLGNLTYSYDAAGRRTGLGGSFASAGLPPALSAATYDAANQLTQWESQTITHDANGSITNDGVTTFSWDARNRLTAAGAASFTYDDVGRRASRTAGGNTRSYLYDGLNIAREVGDTSTTANIVASPFLDDVFSRHAAGGAEYFLKDALGSTLALTAADGTVSTTYTYDPFGATTSSGASTANDTQFTGQENDGSALYFFRARYYSTKLQRFVSEDPVFPLSGPNPYTYVFNNPLNWVDPLGLCSANASGAERLASFVNGLADAALGVAKGLMAAGELAAAPETLGLSSLAAAYTAASAVGNLGAAYGEVRGAITGNVAAGRRTAAKATAASTVAGAATLALGGSVDDALAMAYAESVTMLSKNALTQGIELADRAEAAQIAAGIMDHRSHRRSACH